MVEQRVPRRTERPEPLRELDPKLQTHGLKHDVDQSPEPQAPERGDAKKIAEPKHHPVEFRGESVSQEIRAPRRPRRHGKVRVVVVNGLHRGQQGRQEDAQVEDPVVEEIRQAAAAVRALRQEDGQLGQWERQQLTLDPLLPEDGHQADHGEVHSKEEKQPPRDRRAESVPADAEQPGEEALLRFSRQPLHEVGHRLRISNDDLLAQMLPDDSLVAVTGRLVVRGPHDDGQEALCEAQRDRGARHDQHDED